MGFITNEELAGLRIQKMILHVVGGESDFEPQTVLEEIEHEDFFLSRIQDLAGDSVHEFIEKSDTKTALERIAQNEVSFEVGAQELSRRFSRDHVRASRDGAFFVFELSTGVQSSVLYGMIKYDYRQAIELYEHEGRNVLRQIVQAFIKERRAIQKFCLVRARAGTVELAVCAQDRMGKAPDLTDYFQKFLDVIRERSDQELNVALKEAVRAALEACSARLPEGKVPPVLAATKDKLRDREVIDEEAIQEAVFIAAGRPTDENVRAELQKAVALHLKRKRLNGVVFAPDQNELRRAPRRIMRTVEGVRIDFPGHLENSRVTKTIEEGRTTIVVTTAQNLVEDGTLADNNRRTA